MMDSKALEILGLTEKDFKPPEVPQEQRVEELERAMVVLLGGDTNEP